MARALKENFDTVLLDPIVLSVPFCCSGGSGLAALAKETVPRCCKAIERKGQRIPK